MRSNYPTKERIKIYKILPNKFLKQIKKLRDIYEKVKGEINTFRKTNYLYKRKSGTQGKEKTGKNVVFQRLKICKKEQTTLPEKIKIYITSE